MSPAIAKRRQRLTIAQRRRGRELAYFNLGLWAVGNGMVSSTLIVYLAMDLGVSKVGLAISLILAAPRIAGLLRLGAPALIDRLGGRKAFCLGAYAASAVTLLGLPAAVVPGLLPKGNAALGLVVALWCVYHLLEFLATVALMSWLADLVPLRVRGRFFGHRERWAVVGQAAAMLATALFSYLWKRHAPPSLAWAGHAIPAVLGSLTMLLAVVPLAAMPHPARADGPKPRSGLVVTLRRIAMPFLDPVYVPLLIFGCWFSTVNGVTQSAQYLYPAQVLKVGISAMLILQVGLRLGQWAISPWLGRLADRFGNKPLMLASLPLVAMGPVFYLVATPAQPWWIAGTWVVWIAYGGINVGQPNLMLKLSPRGESTAYVAAFHALTGLAVAASTILGGWWLDRSPGVHFPLAGGITLGVFQGIFLIGAVARLMGVAFLLPVAERGQGSTCP